MEPSATVERSHASAGATVRSGGLSPEAEISMRWGRGSLGSETVVLESSHTRTLERAIDVLSDRFRKIWADLARGVAVFMSPSRRHDHTSQGAGDLVRSLAACRSIPVEAFGGGRWESESGDQRSEPDQAYYLGEVALEYHRLRARYHAGETGLDDVEAFEEAHPATLVVEVEHTHYALRKRELCRKIGMMELWELGTACARHAPAIINLQGPEGPRELEVSGLIPGVRPENLHRALVVLEEAGGLVGVSQGLVLKDGRPEELMRAAGMPD